MMLSRPKNWYRTLAVNHHLCKASPAFSRVLFTPNNGKCLELHRLKYRCEQVLLGQGDITSIWILLSYVELFVSLGDKHERKKLLSKTITPCEYSLKPFLHIIQSYYKSGCSVDQQMLLKCHCWHLILKNNSHLFNKSVYGLIVAIAHPGFIMRSGIKFCHALHTTSRNLQKTSTN